MALPLPCAAVAVVGVFRLERVSRGRANADKRAQRRACSCSDRRRACRALRFREFWLAGGVVCDDRHVSMLKIEGFIRAKPRVRHEQNEVVDLLGIPFETTVKWLLGVSPRRLIELLVFLGAKPGPVHHLALCLIGGR